MQPVSMVCTFLFGFQVGEKEGNYPQRTRISSLPFPTFLLSYIQHPIKHFNFAVSSTFIVQFILITLSQISTITMPSPRLLAVRVNSEDADPFSAAPLYYGEDNHGKHGDEHRTHTSVGVSFLGFVQMPMPMLILLIPH